MGNVTIFIPLKVSVMVWTVSGIQASVSSAVTRSERRSAAWETEDISRPSKHRTPRTTRSWPTRQMRRVQRSLIASTWLWRTIHRDDLQRSLSRRPHPLSTHLSLEYSDTVTVTVTVCCSSSLHRSTASSFQHRRSVNVWCRLKGDQLDHSGLTDVKSTLFTWISHTTSYHSVSERSPHSRHINTWVQQNFDPPSLINTSEDTWIVATESFGLVVEVHMPGQPVHQIWHL